MYLSLGPHKGFPRYRRSLQPSKENQNPALQNMKVLISYFPIFWGHFCPPDLIESGSNPGSEHCSEELRIY
jgi:hypothetical protein